MATLRQMIDGTGVSIHADKDDLVHHLHKAAKAKVDYDVAKANLQSKLAPMQHLMQLTQQMHGPAPNVQDPNDPFQNPYMQEGQGGPGGVGQGMENQDDLQRTGQMQKPSPGGVDNYLKKGANGNQPGNPQNDGNKRLQTPDSRLAQGKPQQRSASGNKPPGKMTQPTEGKPVKKGKKIKLEISDDSLKAGGPGSGRRPSWQPDSRNQDVLNRLHQQGADRGFRYKSTSSSGVGKMSHEYEAKGGGQRGGARATLNEMKNGDHYWSGSLRNDMKAEAIKNGMKRCKTCKNFFNPSHPKAGKNHCPGCKGEKMSAAMTMKRGVPTKTTGDYHDNAGVSMPSVAVGLSARKSEAERAYGKTPAEKIAQRNPDKKRLGFR